MSGQEKKMKLTATLRLPREVISGQDSEDQHFYTAELAESLARFAADLSQVVSELCKKRPGDKREFDISIVCDFRSTRKMAAMVRGFRDAVNLTTNDGTEDKLITF